jgi:hypothetical protein
MGLLGTVPDRNSVGLSMSGQPIADGDTKTATSSDATSFWKTLPGILTAAGTFLAGLAGVAAVFFGGRDTAGNTAEGGVYIAAKAHDGFVAMRVQPTKDSAEITRISVGDMLNCGAARPNSTGYPWRKCRDAEGNQGYVSDLYLQKR